LPPQLGSPRRAALAILIAPPVLVELHVCPEINLLLVSALLTFERALGALLVSSTCLDGKTWSMDCCVPSFIALCCHTHITSSLVKTNHGGFISVHGSRGPVHQLSHVSWYAPSVQLAPADAGQV
jgi:hypothetical protein